MASPTYTVKVLKKDEVSAELEVKATQDDVVGLWPSLVLRLLEDPPGSPLKGKRVYDPEESAALQREVIAGVVLVKAKKGSAVLRVEVRDPKFVGHLKKGLAWDSYHYPTDSTRLVDAAFVPDGSLAVVGSSSGVAELRPVSAKGLGATKAWLNHPGLVAVDARGERILTAGGTTVALWDGAGKAQVGVFEVGEEVACARLSPTGDRVAVGFREGGAVLIDGEKGAVRARYEGGIGPVQAVAFASDGESVLVGGGDGVTRRYGIRGTLLEALAGHEGAVRGISVSEDGRQVVTVGEEGTARVFQEGTFVRALRHDEKLNTVFQGALPGAARDAAVFFRGAGLMEVTLPGGELREIAAPRERFSALIAASGLVLTATTERARLIRRDGTEVREVKLPRVGLGGSITSQFLFLSPDERWLAAPHLSSDHKDGRVELHAVEGREVVRLPNPSAGVPPREDTVQAVAWVDAERLLVGYAMHPAILWSVTGERLATLDERTYEIQVAGEAIVTRQSPWFETPGGFTVRDRALTVLGTLPSRNEGRLWSVSRDGRYAVLSEEGDAPTYRVWDLATRETWALDPRGKVGTATFAGSDRYLVLCPPYDGRAGVRIFDVAARAHLATIPREEEVWQVFFAKDGESLYLVSSSYIERFDRGGASLGRIDAPPPVPFQRPIVGAHLDARGVIFTSSEDTPTVRVWKKGDTPMNAHAGWSGGRLVQHAKSGLMLGVGQRSVEVFALLGKA
ncbi:WD40 repeat domain-containing protein [Chondromyces apiculatus]|nr:WD40 repeat domain-containing protein [Chondromyces apiculatus]